MRVLTMLVIVSLTLPAPLARAGSTIRLVPKTESEPEDNRARDRSRDPKDEVRDRAEPAEDPDAPRELDLTPKSPPVALDRVPAEVAAQKEGPPVMPLVGIGLSVVAGIVGTIFLVEAGNNLDPDNFTIETSGEGEDLEVELSDRFVDAQNAVISNGIAGSILVSSATAGLLASILTLTTHRRR